MEKLDILNRDSDVERIQSIIQIVSERKGNTSFAINGDWGSGKSFVLNMMEESLELIQNEETATNRYLVFHYDSWKYDYYEEPILAIVASMLDTLDEKVSILGKKQKAIAIAGLKKVGGILLNIANTVVEAKTGVNIKGIYDDSKELVKEAEGSTESKHQFDTYFAFNKTLNGLRNTIQELSETYTILFIVDELDRCLPSYAIKVLERLHHITTDLPNTVTIIATDKERLGKIIETTIGVQDINAYLKKFIKFEVSLGVGDTNDEIEAKFQPFFSRFEGQDKAEAMEYVHAILQNVDIRSITHMIDLAELANSILTDCKLDYSVMCMEVLILVLKSAYDCQFEIGRTKLINKESFLLTLNHRWNSKSTPMTEFIKSKSEPRKWSLIMVGHNEWNEQMIVHETSSMYEKLCYYFSLIVGGSNVSYERMAETEWTVEENGKYIQDFMNLINLID